MQILGLLVSFFHLYVPLFITTQHVSIEYTYYWYYPITPQLQTCSWTLLNQEEHWNRRLNVILLSQWCSFDTFFIFHISFVKTASCVYCCFHANEGYVHCIIKIRDLKSRNWPDYHFFDGIKYHRNFFCENEKYEFFFLWYDMVWYGGMIYHRNNFHKKW